MGMQCHADLLDMYLRDIPMELRAGEDGNLEVVVKFESGDVHFPFGNREVWFDCRSINHGIVLELCRRSIPFTCS